MTDGRSAESRRRRGSNLATRSIAVTTAGGVSMFAGAALRVFHSLEPFLRRTVTWGRRAQWDTRRRHRLLTGTTAGDGRESDAQM